MENILNKGNVLGCEKLKQKNAKLGHHENLREKGQRMKKTQNRSS